MTVSTSYSALTFAGNSSTTAFAVSWPFFTGTLVVTAISAAGVRTTQTLGTHYTVTGGTSAVGLPATGTVTMVTAPATGTQLEIRRETPITQASVWNDNSAFPAKTIESQLDRTTLIAQELDYNSTDNLIDFTLTAGTTTTGAAGTSAVATVTGTYPAFTLDLTIPRGDAGASGAGTGDLLAANNLSDLASKKTGYDNLSVHGADIASASTIDLDAATGNLVDVTGTTAITAITLSNGRERTVRFTGALTLTSGASLVLPTGANITTVAGDYAIFRGYAAGVVRCVNYERADGTPLALATNQVTTAKIADNNVTLAKLPTQADSTVVANVSGGVAVPTAATITSVLDKQAGGSVAQGDILYRNATVWARLGAGTSGQVLQTNGAGANPSWATSSNTGWEKIGSTTIAGAVASVSHSWSAGAYTKVIVHFGDLSGTSAVGLHVYLMTAVGGTVIVDAAGYGAPAATISHLPASFVTGHVAFDIGIDAATRRSIGIGVVSDSGGATGTMGSDFGTPAIGGNATDAKAITVAFGAGNIDDGIITVYGLKA